MVSKVCYAPTVWFQLFCDKKIVTAKFRSRLMIFTDKGDDSSIMRNGLASQSYKTGTSGVECKRRKSHES